MLAGLLLTVLSCPVVALAACTVVHGNNTLSATALNQIKDDEDSLGLDSPSLRDDIDRGRQVGRSLGAVRRLEGQLHVGYGHLIAARPCTAELTRQWTITNQAAISLLGEDVQGFVRQVNRLVSQPLTQEQFDALVDFAYNAGVGSAKPGKDGKLHGLIGSGVLAAVNDGDFQRAGQRILSWISKRERVTSGGLVARREHEATPFLHSQGASCPGHPTVYPSLAGRWLSQTNGSTYVFTEVGPGSYSGYVVDGGCAATPGDIRDTAGADGHYMGVENTFSDFGSCTVSGTATNTIRISANGKTAAWDSAGCSDCGPQIWTRDG